MPSAAAIIACALTLLGRSERTMPPIVLVDHAPSHASAGVEAFVSLPDPNIYVVTSSPVFQEAQASRAPCGDPEAVKKLASILAHEEWHILHGSDERGAYLAQLTTLLRIGVLPDKALYTSVTRAMLRVMKSQNQKPDMLVASSGP
jgi:hypothetical protein